MTRIVPVETSRQLSRFIDFPHDLYANDENYVPELFVGQRDMLTPGKHPFYNHAEIKLFLAFQEDKTVGRIAAIVNHSHNEFTARNDAFFGFFDCVNDYTVAKALFDEALAWLKSGGFDTVIGPVNFSTNDSCGILLEGYDSPPIAMMPYNKPYYNSLVQQYGFTKKTDLLAYELNVAGSNDRSLKLMETLKARLAKNGITIRQVNLKDFKNEAFKIREVYNSAWDKNLGFVPMSKEEFEHLAKELKMIVDPKFCLVAEKDGQFIGWILGIPDINQILIKIKRGRLFPTGLFKLLTGRKNITRIRVMTLGVLEPYRKMGIEACLYASVIKNTFGTKVTGGECSWMLEDNYMMNHAIEQLNGKLYKKYRLYEKAI